MYKQNETVYKKISTANYSTHFHLQYHHQTKKSIKKFLRSSIAKVARLANMKCSGTRLEVSESQHTERGGVEKGGGK